MYTVAVVKLGTIPAVVIVSGRLAGGGVGPVLILH